MARDGSPLRPSGPRPGVLAGSLLLAAAYVATGAAFRTEALGPIADVLAWPPIGIALGLVLLWGPRVWPGMVAAALLEPWLAGIPVARFLGSSAGLTLEVLGAAWMLRRLGFHNALERVRDVVLFAGIAIFGGAILGAAVNTSYQVLTGIRPASEFLGYCFSCFRGDALAFLVLTPLVITWGGDLRFTWLRARKAEWAALIATLVPTAYMLMGGLHRFWTPTFPLRYLLFPWLFWAALRFGPPGVALTNLIVVTMASQGDWLRFGLPETGEMVTNRLLLLWGYSFLGCLMGLVLAAVARQQEQARRQNELIRQANLALARHLDLQGVLDTLLEYVEKLVPYDTGNVMLIEGKTLVTRAGRHYEKWSDREVVGLRFPVSDLPMWEAVRGGQSVIVSDTLKEKRWIVMKGTEYVRNWLAVPIKAGGEPIGLYALDKAEPGYFNTDHIRLVESLAAQAAIAIQNARMFEERKRAEDALRQSEERFSKSFYSHPNPMMLSRLSDGHLLDFNDSYVRFFGYTREEIFERRGRDFCLNPAERGDLVQLIRDQGRLRDVELQMRTKTGETRTGLTSAELIDIGGEQCILGVIRDITERRRAEQALWSSEERFVKAFRSSPALMAILTLPELRVMDANDSFLRILGFSREEIIGRTGEELGVEVDLQVQFQLRDQLEREGSLSSAGYAIRTRAGEVRQLLLSAEIIELAGEKHALIVALDVTEQRRLEERFKRAFQSSPAAMSISTLADGRYVDVNDGYLRMLGYSRDEVIGRSAIELGVWAAPEERAVLVDALQEHGRVENFEISLRAKSGETHTGLLFADTVDLGGVPHLLSAVLDMTEYRKLEEQFRQSQKMDAIGRLAGGIAHDFNNLLMVMIGRADLLLVQMKEGDPALKAVEEIQKAAWRAASLTRQLLAFSRKQRLEPKVLNLNDSVADMERMLHRLIGEHITLTVETDRALGNIKADPGGIEQVLMNLCVNARDAMPHGGYITITTASAEFDVPFPMRHGTLAPGRYALLAVSDTGSGMDPATQARIFEPFFTTKEPGKGTGLGLSTVYGIVQQSGGAVSVYSEPGHGTTFKVYFPVIEDAVDSAAAARRSADGSLPRGTETILLVEDEDPVRNIAAEYLTVAGYTVLEARNAAEALERSAKHPGSIQLLLTDVILPGMSGRQLADRLRSEHPRLRILYLSGYTADVTASQGLLPAGAPLIEKPFRLAVFASKVRSALDGAPTTTA